MFYLTFTDFWNSLRAYNLLDRSKMIEMKLVCNYESLWNHVVIQQGVFIRLKITSYITIFQWIILKIHEVSDFSNSQFLEKMQKFICKLPKCFANCELRSANSNPVFIVDFLSVPIAISITVKPWLKTRPFL